ncbi:MAG: bifunctional riboflavin kinase/FMN adenylyltransferase [Candidatus Eisenbacteria bacterium]|nr:bifunctional riboflavin kinase/FMN adenylyltransferase [Candidatus Eisenbacteria bacterium]
MNASAPRRAVTLGVFDGLHRGHKALVDRLTSESERRGLVPTVVTLDPHPDTVLGLAPERPPLTPAATQAAILAEWGAREFRVLRFDTGLRGTPASDFARDYLAGALGAQLLVVGPDFALGRDREGTPARMAELGRGLGFEVIQVPPVSDEGGHLSSSRVRHLLDEGRVTEVAGLLGRPFSTSGRVTSGSGVGAGLGFPTANLEPPEPVYLPADGVYMGRASGGFGVRPCLVSLGTRPTFGPGERVLEVYLLDFEGNLRDQPMLLEWLEFHRGQQRFHSPADLVEQMRLDEVRARQWLAVHGP